MRNNHDALNPFSRWIHFLIRHHLRLGNMRSPLSNGGHIADIHAAVSDLHFKRETGQDVQEIKESVGRIVFELAYWARRNGVDIGDAVATADDVMSGAKGL